MNDHHCNKCPYWEVKKIEYPFGYCDETFCNIYDQQLYYLYGEENQTPHICKQCAKRFSYVPYIEKENKMKIEQVDYIINSIPTSISLNCPYCEAEIKLPFEQEYWGNDGQVFIECPECGKEIELGEWDYE